jgi:hypothetical protein
MPNKKSKPLSKKVKLLQVLEVANDQALSLFDKLDQSARTKDINAMFKHYMDLIRKIDEMAESYREMSNPVNYLLFAKHFLTVEARSMKALKVLMEKIYTGKSPELTVPNEIIDLKYSEEDMGYDGFAQCKTLHDFIRCLHGSSVNSLSSGVGIEIQPKVIEYGNNVFTIVHEGRKNKDLLAVMMGLYKKKEPKEGEENYTVFVTDDILTSRIKMGCHFSNFEVHTGKSRSDISFKFMNTSKEQYPCAPMRAEYVTRVLEMIGFENVRNIADKVIIGKAYGRERKNLIALLNSTVRLIASSKNLDLPESKISGRVDEAINAFQTGKLNIYGYLRNES